MVICELRCQLSQVTANPLGSGGKQLYCVINDKLCQEKLLRKSPKIDGEHIMFNRSIERVYRLSTTGCPSCPDNQTTRWEGGAGRCWLTVAQRAGTFHKLPLQKRPVCSSLARKAAKKNPSSRCLCFEDRLYRDHLPSWTTSHISLRGILETGVAV